MNTKISPLALPSHLFAQQMYQQLGKGYEHALLLYEEWFRQGRMTGNHPAFNNAPQLLKDLLTLTDLSLLPIVEERRDGETSKILLKTADQFEIESVLIPMRAGGTLCLSSQIGCRMGCAFCETGRMGLLRHLSTAEIINQVFAARFILNFSIRNVVFMGMGEPFDNYESVLQAVRILNDPHGFGLGRNHITISTSGCVDGIYRLLEEPGAIPNLAVSINAPDDKARQKLMPINRKYNLETLYKAMEAFCQKTGRSILIAYVLIKGENDSLEHAEALAHYLTGLNIKINIIPYNRQSHDRYYPSELEQIDLFIKRLRERGYRVLRRQTKGQEIMAACGQLGNVQWRRPIPHNS